MAERRRRQNRRKRKAGFDGFLDLPRTLYGSKATVSPETELMVGVGAMLLNYVVSKVLPGLTLVAPELKSPETIDEHQLGRSEVIQEMARPKRN